MEQERPLEQLLDRYNRGTLTKKELEGSIFRYFLKHYRSFNRYRWEREDCVDYLCWLYPRISRAIDHYRDTGSSFDAYLRSLVRWSLREYRSREADHQVTEYACWNAQALEKADLDMAVCSAEPAYGPDLKPVGNPRQALLLLLKSYYFVSDDFVARAAPAIGMEQEKLRRLVEELRKRRLARDEAIQNFRERVHSQYYRCISLAQRVISAPEGSAFQEKMRLRRDRAEKRLNAMRNRLASIRLDASNRQIAEVLKIPKGTVDSSLHAVKAKERWYESKSPAD